MSASQEVTGSATANGAGNASIVFQCPNGVGGFSMTSIALSVSVSPPIPQCSVYRGVISPNTILATKRGGDKGTFIGTDDVLYPGQSLVVAWTGVSPGAVCTATMRGSRV